jgi:glutamine---fructose-6-phosphate transaminase (isomerizing)
VQGDRIIDLGIDFTAMSRLSMVACGTASYATHVAKYWFEQLAGLPVDIDVASEFRYREPPITPGTVALFVSQSGETADTLAALRYCTGKADRILSVINVPESSIARESDVALPIRAGAEIGVASTKAFTCQLLTLAILALSAAHQRGRIDDAGLAQHLQDLKNLPGLIHHALPPKTPATGSPPNSPRRATSCSSGAGGCIRWPSKAR